MGRSTLWRCLSPLLLILAFCVAAAAATPKTSGPNLSFNTVFGTAWTFADLDGDRQPDLAQSRSVARNGDGQYRVDLALTSGQWFRSFTFQNREALELRLDAIDVDGDNDLDLVITGRYLGQRIGVWLNDGKGSFSKGASSLFPASLEGTSLSASLPDPVNPPAGTKAPRPQGLTRVGFIPPQIDDKPASSCSLLPSVLDFRSGSHHLRAPPQLN
jgi:hypothetical protein